MLIDCPHCKAKVDAKRLKDTRASSEVGEWLYIFLQCPVCDLPMLAEVGASAGPDDIPRRVWPEPTTTFSHHIPKSILGSLTEAARCCECGAYTAGVAMTGRAVEGLCHHFKTKKTTLFDGLKELLGRGVIDNRLYQWADELRKHRNLAAHATGASFSRQDAEDILDFAVAICEYVFVLSTKFEAFTQRTKALAKKKVVEKQ